MDGGSNPPSSTNSYMKYINQPLSFNNDKIFFEESEVESQVMMNWEDLLMSASAAYVCEGGGDILEMGFGMGISAGYIQSHSIDSHTIVENHPDIIPKAQLWASDKPNVKKIKGDWYKNIDKFKTYDGVFFDTYGDKDMNQFSSSLSLFMKSNGRASWWNSVTGSNNFYNIPDVTYEIINVDPPKNNYFNHDKYYLPKKKF